VSTLFWKKARLIVFSFLSGVLIMTGVMIGSKNNQYFTEHTSFADVSQEGKQGEAKPVSTVTSSPISSNNIIADMVDQAGPAVVRIETTTKVQSNNLDPFFRNFFGMDSPFYQPEERNALGSGFIINEDGYIVTNNHVIDGADQIQVFVTNFDKPFDAKIIGKDPELDLAVIKIDSNKKLPYLTLGDSDSIRVGDWSVAIGNPYGLDHTVTVGVISAKERPQTIGNQHFTNLLQTDTAINPGNSGGPLLNLNGEVIGINTAINAEGQGLGFAVPINPVKEVLDDLIKNGKVARPWVGVYLQDLDADLINYFGIDFKEGAVISQVVNGSPAAKAGLQRGDIIVELDGVKIKDSQHLIEVVGKAKIGEKKKLLIWRQGELKSITVTIGEKSYN
jgi:Do/DeqQ family serine protease